MQKEGVNPIGKGSNTAKHLGLFFVFADAEPLGT